MVSNATVSATRELAQSIARKKIRDEERENLANELALYRQQYGPLSGNKAGRQINEDRQLSEVAKFFASSKKLSQRAKRAVRDAFFNGVTVSDLQVMAVGAMALMQEEVEEDKAEAWRFGGTVSRMILALAKLQEAENMKLAGVANKMIFVFHGDERPDDPGDMITVNAGK